MMVNTVPSYCVSLDILLSEYGIGNSTSLKPNKAATNPERSPPMSITTQSNVSKRLHIEGKSGTEIFSEIEELVDDKAGISKPDVSKRLGESSSNPRRWLVLLVYCSISFMQVVVWNTWSPIASAALYTFPNWTAGTVALFSNWGCVCFILFILPTCWMLNEKGLKCGCLLGSTLCTIGSFIRCLPNDEFWFTICAHIGAFLNAAGGVILGPSAVLLSSTWFPVDQRASATGAGTAISALGMAGSYLLGPLMISLPTPDYECVSQKEIIRGQIQKLMYFDFIMHFTFFWFVMLCFPKYPPTPASHTSLLTISYHRNFKRCMKKLIRNSNIWMLGLSAAFSSGMTGPWLSQLTILFSHKNFSSTELARLGFWTIISSCFFSITATRFSDMFQGHIKAILLGLISFGTVMFICIYKLVNSEDNINKYYLIQAVIGGFSASWASTPLFYELGAEIAYPVPEGIVAGYIMSMSSVSSVIAYGLFYLTSQTGGLIWLNYGLVAYNIAAFVFLLFVKEQYNRLTMEE